MIRAIVAAAQPAKLVAACAARHVIAAEMRTNHKCKCSKIFYGDVCEHKIVPNGSFSLLLFLFVIGLVAAGIALLY